MNNTKRILSAVLTAACVLSLTACSEDVPAPSQNNSGTTPPTTTTTAPAATMNEQDKEAVAGIEIDAEKLENPNVKFLSSWDLNPVEGTEVPVALEMFQTKYGGKIEYIQCTWEERYNKLAAMVMSGDSPDMFSAGDLDVYPKGAINKMFDPLDGYVDFDSELWKPMKAVNDQFIFNGKHYVGAVSTNTATVMIYNTRVMADNDLTDPRELLEQNNWTWDTFWDMMTKFCDRDQDKFAIDGWWFEGAFSQTCGKPYIGMENGQVVHYLDDPAIEKVQQYMYNMKVNDLPVPKSERAWQVTPSYVASGKTLFYPCGVWALEKEDLSDFGTMDEIAFVPMPRCPDADAYYLPSVIDGFALCKGSENPKGVAAYLNCAMACYDNEVAKEISNKQKREEYGWTDEMFEMLEVCRDLTAEHPVIEFYNAVTDKVADLINNPMKEGYNNLGSWTQIKESIRPAVQAELDAANAKLAE